MAGNFCCIGVIGGNLARSLPRVQPSFSACQTGRDQGAHFSAFAPERCSLGNFKFTRGAAVREASAAECPNDCGWSPTQPRSETVQLILVIQVQRPAGQLTTGERLWVRVI